jgi:hypothetical protein
MMVLLGMQNFLRANKIPYLITSSMGNNTELEFQKKYVSSSVLNQIYNKRYYVTPSFSKFCEGTNYEIGPQLHPLEEGHIAWADHLIAYIEQNNLLSNKDL